MTIWLDHKLRATGRVIDKFALYTQNLQNFIESSKPSDRGPLQGKLNKLLEAKVVLPGAFFSGILHEARKLSLVTQKSDINIIDMVEAVESCKRNYERLLRK